MIIDTEQVYKILFSKDIESVKMAILIIEAHNVEIDYDMVMKEDDWYPVFDDFNHNPSMHIMNINLMGLRVKCTKRWK